MKNKKEKAQRKKLQLKTWHWAAVITAAVLVVLVSAIGIWWSCMDVESFSEGWALICNLVDPPENDVRYKDSYSVSDKKAQKWADKVVATVGGQELTNGQLQVYYWTGVYTYLTISSQYTSDGGLDYTLPLDEQVCPETGDTWQQYFLEKALESWHQEQALALMAQENGVTLGVDEQVDLKNLRQSLTETMVDEGYTSVDAMLQHDMGAGCDFDDYYSYRQTYYYANAWFTAGYEQRLAAITSQDMEDYYAANQEALAEEGITKNSGNVYDVRHILIAPEGGTSDEEGNVTYTDAAWADCQKEAQEIFDEWLATDQSEALFAAYANDYSMDTGSNTSGGLYEDLTEDTQIVEEFVAWYSEDGRQVGDYGLIRTELGYHIMYLSAMEPQWEAAVREGLMSDASDQLVSEAVEKYPMQVTYADIVLSVVDLQNIV